MFKSFDCDSQCVQFAYRSDCLFQLKGDVLEVLVNANYRNVEIETMCGSLVVNVMGTTKDVDQAVEFLSQGCFELRRFGEICIHGDFSDKFHPNL